MSDLLKRALARQQPKAKRGINPNGSLDVTDIDVRWISGKGLYLVIKYGTKNYYIKATETP